MDSGNKAAFFINYMYKEIKFLTTCRILNLKFYFSFFSLEVTQLSWKELSETTIREIYFIFLDSNVLSLTTIVKVYFHPITA